MVQRPDVSRFLEDVEEIANRMNRLFHDGAAIGTWLRAGGRSSLLNDGEVEVLRHLPSAPLSDISVVERCGFHLWATLYHLNNSQAVASRSADAVAPEDTNSASSALKAVEAAAIRTDADDQGEKQICEPVLEAYRHARSDLCMGHDNAVEYVRRKFSPSVVLHFLGSVDGP